MKFDLKLKAKDNSGNRMRVKSTIMMRDTKITKISIMRMAITMSMDMMITITQMATTMNLNITKKKFIISTEIINLKDTREAEATRWDKLFQGFKINMEAFSSLEKLTTSVKKVRSIVIEIIIKEFLIIRVHSRMKMELKKLRKEKFFIIISKKIIKNLKRKIFKILKKKIKILLWFKKKLRNIIQFLNQVPLIFDHQFSLKISKKGQLFLKKKKQIIKTQLRLNLLNFKTSSNLKRSIFNLNLIVFLNLKFLLKSKRLLKSTNWK